MNTSKVKVHRGHVSELLKAICNCGYNSRESDYPYEAFEKLYKHYKKNFRMEYIWQYSIPLCGRCDHNKEEHFVERRKLCSECDCEGYKKR